MMLGRQYIIMTLYCHLYPGIIPRPIIRVNFESTIDWPEKLGDVNLSMNFI
jgi:hypothetical protein